MIKNIYEILDEFENATNDEERKEVLQNNAVPHFKKLLEYCFNENHQFYITEFPKDYIIPDTEPGIRVAGIESELRRAYLFLKGNNVADNLTEEKRNILLLQLLESFEPKEADIFVNMMKKDLQIPGLTLSLVQETFPELFN